MNDICLKTYGRPIALRGDDWDVWERLRTLADKGLEFLDFIEGRRKLEMTLAPGLAWGRSLSGDWVVACRAGTVWITAEGDPDDHILGPGGALKLTGRGRLAMLAVGGEARVTVSRPAKP